MIELRVTSAAEADYADAVKWYLEQSQETAERFDVEFHQALNAIAANPERFPRCGTRHRFLLLRHFPYQIIYRPLGSDCRSSYGSALSILVRAMSSFYEA